MKNIKEQRGFLEIKNTYRNQKPKNKFGKHQRNLSGSKRKMRSRWEKMEENHSIVHFKMVNVMYILPQKVIF